MGDLDSLTNLLAGTNISKESGVSFEGKSLKLNTEEDAKDVVDAIKNCKDLTFLNLEGNTLGIDAAKGISKALEGHPEFKKALWKDIFTGRLKEEIPEALRYLGSGLILAGATLTELNLSDNAFGPIGVEGLASLLKSPCCYALQELKLNNNGLGISGGKLLSKALLSCYNSSKELSKPLALKVFIAGRNRLENEGAKALAEVFKVLKSLEEINMPQNGIYHVGVTALADSFQSNPNLRVINLNDNTLGRKGSIALAKVLPQLQSLTYLNLGDCLLKSSGAISIAEALKQGHSELQDVHISCNEIGRSGGLAVAEALATKKKLSKIDLDGNQFGEDGIKEIKNKLKSGCSTSVDISISDDEGEEDEDEEGSDDEEEEEEEEEKSNEEESTEKEVERNCNEKDKSMEVKENSVKITTVQQQNGNIINITAADFLKNPTPENFLALGTNGASLLLEEVKKQPEENYFDFLVTALMKVSSLIVMSVAEVNAAALACSDLLYREIFQWANSKDRLPLVNNTLLVHLGLLKSEDKKFKVVTNVEGCKIALCQAMRQNYFPTQSKDTMNLFLERQVGQKGAMTVVL